MFWPSVRTFLTQTFSSWSSWIYLNLDWNNFHFNGRFLAIFKWENMQHSLLLEFYILAMPTVNVGWEPHCDSAQSWYLYSATSLRDHPDPLSHSVMDTDLTSPCLILLTLSAKLKRQLTMLYIISLTQPGNKLPISHRAGLHTMDSAHHVR